MRLPAAVADERDGDDRRGRPEHVRSGREQDEVAPHDQYAVFSVGRGPELYYMLVVHPKVKPDSSRPVTCTWSALTSKHRKRSREARRPRAALGMSKTW
jgi:hypothetical protein